MIIVSGRLHVAPDAREAYLSACEGVVEQARKAPGCLDFVLSADRLEPGRINVYERWESDAHVEKFRSGEGGSPGDSEPGRAAAVLDADVRKYRISGVEAA
ncbi:putative quinol monooxygenase [Streptomyces sp. NPDC059788]|uniref:putative quinol monooxygenase n=1 Tax=Streptomyces sp. NPDC059788 TaxID=3346948 RepID=UPI0036679ABF